MLLCGPMCCAAFDLLWRCVVQGYIVHAYHVFFNLYVAAHWSSTASRNARQSTSKGQCRRCAFLRQPCLLVAAGSSPFLSVFVLHVLSAQLLRGMYIFDAIQGARHGVRNRREGVLLPDRTHHADLCRMSH